MKKIIYILLFVFLTVPVFAQFDITGTRPTVNNPIVDAQLATEWDAALDRFRDDISDRLGGMRDEPTNFISSWANANVFASHGATQRALSGYRRIAVTVGGMVAGQFPVSPFRFIDDGTAALEPALRGGDSTFGLNQQFWNIQVGVNMGFLVPNLYLGLRYGGGVVRGATDFEFTSHTFGFMANYQVLPSINLGAVQWRGLNVGTGLIYQTSNIDLMFLLPIVGTEDQHLSIRNSELYFNFDISTWTIPLEVMTAMRFGFFQIPLGIGADLGFGEATMRTGLRGDINLQNLPGGVEQLQAGYLAATGPGGTASPTITSVKLMTGVGFVFGPVVIDFPFTYYFRDRGMNFGVTLGITF